MTDFFNQWLNELDSDDQIKLDEITKKRILNRTLEQIHTQSESHSALNPTSGQHTAIDIRHKSRHFYKKSHVSPSKIAAILLIIGGCFSISMVGYATIGDVQGVFRLTPHLEKQLDRDHPVLPALDEPETLENIPDKYKNTDIVNENSFDTPELYGPVTDITLNNSNGIYSISDIAFNSRNIALFTRENNNAWHLKAGDTLSITIAIDTDFAASETAGEDIVFSYVLDNKYYDGDIHKINDQPFTYTLYAPVEGNYYPCIENMSLTYIKITTLEIKR